MPAPRAASCSRSVPARSSMSPRTSRRALVAAVAMALGLAACGDKESYQQMAQGPRYEPLENGSARPLPPGTVARGHLDDDPLLATGLVDGREAEVFPFAMTRAILA